MASRKFKFTLSTTQRMQRYGFTNALCALKCSGILGRGASTLANANEKTLEISRRALFKMSHYHTWNTKIRLEKCVNVAAIHSFEKQLFAIECSNVKVLMSCI